MLLLDEPLGALDLKLRQQMQVELKNIQRQVGITFVFVTHDQEEALTMSDRIAVFNEGKIEQVGTPAEVYEHPSPHSWPVLWAPPTWWTARWPGGSRVRRRVFHPPGKDPSCHRCRIRSERMRSPRMGGCAMWSTWGLYTRYLVELAGGGDLVVVEQNLKTTSMDVMRARGQQVRLSWKKEHVRYVGD